MATLVTDIPQLKFNKMSKEKYEELLANGELVENEFYITPENEEDISDKADITYVDEQIALKADKETTYTKEEVDSLVANVEVNAYTKEEVDNLIANIDIPEQTPNIKGGEYIDVIEPKGETLYEYDVFDMMEATGIIGCNNMFLTTNTFDYVGMSMFDITPLENRISDLYGSKISDSFAQYLVPALKSDGTQYKINEIISDSYFELAKSNLPNENFETIDDVLLYASYDNIDPSAPISILKFEQDGSQMLVGVYQDKLDNYIFLAATAYDITPINTIVSEPSDKSLTIDFNEKALEMIENAGSDITTNGWNIFDHKFSDHLLNDPSWVRSDTYSWQDGGIYFTAYEELEKENSGRIEDKEIIKYYAWQIKQPDDGGNIAVPPLIDVNAGTLYTLVATPTDTDDVYAYSNETTELTTSENVLFTSFENELMTVSINGSSYTYERYLDGDVNEIETGNTSTDTIGDITITYYKSTNGLKICLPDQSDAIEQLYANTGVAWYYIIDTENKRFKLPRKVSETLDLNTVAVVGNGNDIYWSFSEATQNNKTLAVSAHSLGVDGVIYQVDSGANVGLTADPTKSGIIADLSTIGYKEVTEQTYLYFFMGDTLRDARIIDVNVAIEKIDTVEESLNDKANIDLSNILENIDYVVESYHEGLNWYRIYKSGWVEQGGFYQAQTSGWNDITLLKEMTNSYYSCKATLCGSSSDTESAIKVGGETINTTTVLKINMTERYACHWEVKGQGAQ